MKEPERYYEWMLWKLRQTKGTNMNKVNGKTTAYDANWSKDINNMHFKFGVHKWVNKMIYKKDYYTLHEFLQFRMRFLDEELNETKEAIKYRHADDIVDGLIDLCVIAIGTLDILGVNANKAWNRVHRANMAKEVGQKESRPNDLGLPDMIKPDDWIGPDHKDNTGNTDMFLKSKNDVDIWRKVNIEMT